MTKCNIYSQIMHDISSLVDSPSATKLKTKPGEDLEAPSVNYKCRPCSMTFVAQSDFRKHLSMAQHHRAELEKKYVKR